MVLIIYVVHGMDFRHYFLEIVCMHTLSTVLPIDYNRHWFLQLKMSMLFENSFLICTMLSILSLLLLSILMSCRLLKKNEIEHMLATRKHDSRHGANQISNLQRLRTTRWSSHYDSEKSLIDKYIATCKVLEYLSDHSPNG